MITNLGLFFINYNCKAISLHLVMMPDPMQLTIRNFYLSSIPAGILIRLLGPVLCLFFSVFISIGQPVSTDRAREVSEYTDTLGRTDTTHNDLLADLFDNDTVIVTYMRYGDLFTLLPFEDSLLSLSLRQMDVARSQNVEYFTLGNIGSPAYSPLVRPVTREPSIWGITAMISTESLSTTSVSTGLRRRTPMCDMGQQPESVTIISLPAN